MTYYVTIYASEDGVIDYDADILEVATMDAVHRVAQSAYRSELDTGAVSRVDVQPGRFEDCWFDLEYPPNELESRGPFRPGKWSVRVDQGRWKVIPNETVYIGIPVWS